MHQARALTASIAQGVQHAVHMARGAGTALDAKPHGLVEDENVVILVERDRTQKLTRLFFRFGEVSRFRRIEPEWRGGHRPARLPPVPARHPPSAVSPFPLSGPPLGIGKRQRRET